jgi:hypothetical protein
MDPAFVPPPLLNYLAEAPLLVVWAIGAVLALARWRAHPRVSLLALAGLTLLMLESLIDVFLGAWLPVRLHAMGWPMQRIGGALFVQGVVQALFKVLGWTFLLGAVFAGRGR